MDYEASLCPGCGHPQVETLDPANSTAYEAVPLTCHACAARDAERRLATTAMTNERYSKAAFDGLMIGVIKKGAASG